MSVDYAIFQVKHGVEYRDIRFEGTEFLRAIGKSVDAANYEPVWAGTLDAELSADRPNLVLDRLFTDFNLNIPEGYTGRSMSVSDVVVLKQGSEKRAFFVEPTGFKEVPSFLQQIECMPKGIEGLADSAAQAKNHTEPEIKSEPICETSLDM